MVGRRRSLTPRQAEILDLVAGGLGDKEIARRLGISTNTVRTHLQRVYRDQRVANRAAAASIRVGERAPAAGGWDLSRPAIVIATLMAVAVLLVGAPRVFGLASALLPQPAVNRHGEAAAAGTPVPGHPAAAPQATSPTSMPTIPHPAAGIRALPPPAVSPPVTTTDPAREELAIVNQYRAAAGLAPLAWNSCLAGVASTDASKIASRGPISPTGGEAADLACAPGRPIEIFISWSSADDAAASRVIFANPSWQPDLLGAGRLFGAAWAPGTGGDYLVLEIV
jgi:DNA-binding CsgD family transcriptional regulator